MTEAGDLSGPPPSLQKVPWWCSWPVIIVLELFCFIPAVVMVWLRPVTTTATKWIATMILVGIPVLATALDYAHNR